MQGDTIAMTGKEAAEREISQLQSKLMNLGFVHRALTDLHKLAENNKNPHKRKLAARVLSIWYGRMRNIEGAQKCLEILDIAAEEEDDPDVLRKINIMKAESLALLSEFQAAQELIQNELAHNIHTDLYLAAANLETTPLQRIGWINKALELHDLFPITFDTNSQIAAFDCLQGEYFPSNYKSNENLQPRVSVIMPAYNASNTIQTALGSLLSQTWSNLEVIIVDDGSQDNTVQIAREYEAEDPRVKVIANSQNRGPYVARNTALEASSGELICCHDTDDWSHPQLIETQVSHLQQNPEVLANTSKQARATPELLFYRRNRFGYYLINNLPSFMFRRSPVLENLGCWDSVRFSADSEFMRRLKRIFGKDKVVNMETGPLCFQRQHSFSLTGHEYFGAEYFYVGARKEYYEAQLYYHRNSKSLYYQFPQLNRPFAVPEPMWPSREAKENKKRHFDVVYAADFRTVKSTIRNAVEEIKLQKRLGLKTGLVQMGQYHIDPQKHISSMVRELIDGDKLQMLVYGEHIYCDLLVIFGPTILQEWQKFIPNIEAKEIRVIADKPPVESKGPQTKKKASYNITSCKNNLEEYFNQAPLWHPAHPLARREITTSEEYPLVTWSNEDWLPIVDTDVYSFPDFKSKGSSHERKIRIGRHGEDIVSNWPENAQDLLDAYPSSNDYEVFILGGAKIPQQMIEEIPSNWHFYKIRHTSIENFLSWIDVFVFCTSKYKSSFTVRPLLEAMAAGVPVICSHQYSELLGKAAIYAEPAEVKMYVDWLMQNKKLYQKKSKLARKFVKEKFGPSVHLKRLKKLTSHKKLTIKS